MARYAMVVAKPVLAMSLATTALPAYASCAWYEELFWPCNGETRIASTPVGLRLYVNGKPTGLRTDVRVPEDRIASIRLRVGDELVPLKYCERMQVGGNVRYVCKFAKGSVS